MPRNPEWVQPKAYDRWKGINYEKILEGFDGKRKPGKEKPGKQKPEKPGEPEKQPGTERPGKEPLAIEGPPNKPGQTPGEPGGPRPHGGRQFEELEGSPGRRGLPPGRPRGPREQGGVERPPLGGSGPRPALGASTEHGPMNEVERRHAAVADLVEKIMAQKAARKSGANPETGPGEIVEPGVSYQASSADRDRSIRTAEVVGHNEGRDTNRIRAIEAPSHDKATGPVPRIHDTAPINVTAPLPRTTAETTELPRLGRQFAPETPRRALPGRAPESGIKKIQNAAYEVGKLAGGASVGAARAAGRASSGQNALTQHEEPFGQMSMFNVPAALGQVHLDEAQTSRTERQDATPAATMPPGRQVNFMVPNLPKKPGSQGTLFKTVRFRSVT